MKLYFTGKRSAAENMEIDRELLESLDPNGDPILHLYRWKTPCLTFGHFFEPRRFLDLEKAHEEGIEIAQRPTGGGALFHMWDLAFSFVMPANHPRFSQKTADNYRFVNGIVALCCQEVFPSLAHSEWVETPPPAVTEAATSFCMARPTEYDLIYGGQKRAGAAQRKKAQGYLHQGTIPLVEPNFGLVEKILLDPLLVGAMRTYTWAPLGSHIEEGELERVKQRIEKKLEEKFMEHLA